MKATEAAALLTIAAAYDNRKPDADQAKAWAMALDDLRFEDCRTVIVEHYKRSREWLMPVDVVQGVRRLREKRLADYGPLPAPAVDPDNTERYQREEARIRRDVADGTLLAPEPSATDRVLSRDVIRELGHVGQTVDEALVQSARDAFTEGKRAKQETEAAKKRAEDERRADREAAMAAARAALRGAASEEDV